MSDTSNAAWTAEQIADYAQRFGLHFPSDQAPAMLSRLRELADITCAAGQAIPRQAAKDDEPASVFRVPLKK